MRRFAMIRNMYQPKTSRDLLLDLGVTSYNATMLIETLMMAPATTEAAAAPTMLLVGHIQEVLNELGADLVPNGYIDAPTAMALATISGKGFLHRSWFDVVKDVVVAKRCGCVKIHPPRARAPNPQTPQGALDFLPDVPGGLLTYAAGGLVLWHFLSKKSKRV